MGAGNVGGGLGAAFVAVGHVVVVGVRAPESEKTKAAIASRPGAIATSFAFNTIGFENLATACWRCANSRRRGNSSVYQCVPVANSLPAEHFPAWPR